MDIFAWATTPMKLFLCAECEDVFMNDERLNRKWMRYAWLLPCQIVSLNKRTLSPVAARIINASRTGALVESDYLFWPEDKVTLLLPGFSSAQTGIPSNMYGTVRWEQMDSPSCMASYSFGVEFETIIPFRKFFSPAHFDTVYCCA